MYSAPDSSLPPLSSAEKITRTIDAALLEGFHAMAQPLTILQSHIESQLLARPQGEGANVLLEALATEVERLCSLLRPLQQLVASRECCKHPDTIDAWDALAPILEDFALFFANSHVDFEIVPSASSLPLVRVAAGSLREMVSGMLSAAAAAATLEDWVQTSFKASEQGLSIAVTNRSRNPRPLPVLVQLNLALAEVRALGEGGELLIHRAPFSARLLLSSLPLLHESHTESTKDLPASMRPHAEARPG